MTLVCGVEEAGRGPVIGPLVMCGVVMDEKMVFELDAIGVKDSKLLSPQQRESLFDKIKQMADGFKIIILSAQDVDDTLNDPNMNLNWLEAKTSAKIINQLKVDKAILDCPSNNIEAYRNYVKKYIRNEKMELIAEHKADLNYTIVGAASILAKVTRDREIEKIKQKINKEFGSGYPSDPRTVKFLKENYDKHSEIFRKTWSSYKKVAEAKKQRNIGDF
jgi:ribonuclease HII